MNDRITIVLLDCISGAAGVILGLPLVTAVEVWAAPVALVAGVGVGWILYRADRGEFTEREQELMAYGVVLGLVVLLGGGLALVGPLGLVGVVQAALLGGGTALLGYRFVYGVVRPIPDARLDRYRDSTF